jgi:FMN phosphatase YigB (HAD superfamily)
MIKGILFDVGGVLAHDVWENMLLDDEKSVTQILGLNSDRVATVARELWKEFAHRSTTPAVDWRTLEFEYWRSFIQQLGLRQSPKYFIDRTNEFIQPVPGMIDLLSELRGRDIKLAICSNNTEFWFARQMDKLNLREFFNPDQMIVSSRIGMSKGSPTFRMFEAAIESLQVNKKNCILVDDRETSILRSVEFGLAAIIFPSHSDRGAQYLKLLLQKLAVL